MRGLPKAVPAVAVAVAALAWVACGTPDTVPPEADPVAAARAAGWHVDSVGVVNLAEGDTLNQEAGLTILEMTRIFPPDADSGEVFAWEFQAQNLNPVKLLIVRALDGAKRFEILGESPMVVPRRIGANRFELPEPIPLRYPSILGIYMPEAGAVPFRKIRNWKALIAMRPLDRPFIERTPFAMYGWRYGVRAFWRRPLTAADTTAADTAEIDTSGGSL